MNKSLMRISADQHDLEPHCFTATCVIASNGDGYSANRGYIDAEIISEEHQGLPYVTATPVYRVKGGYCDSPSRVVSGIHVDMYA